MAPVFQGKLIGSDQKKCYSILDLLSPYLILKIAHTLGFDNLYLIDICPNEKIKSLFLKYFQ
jgi:hypothetical protein